MFASHKSSLDLFTSKLTIYQNKPKWDESTRFNLYGAEMDDRADQPKSLKCSQVKQPKIAPTKSKLAKYQNLTHHYINDEEKSDAEI